MHYAAVGHLWRRHQQRHRQHSPLGAVDRLHLPAVPSQPGRDAVAALLHVELGAIGEGGVFQQCAPFPHGQHVHEAKPVVLVDGGIHHDGPGESVRRAQRNLLAVELLVAALRGGSSPTAGIDHRTRLQPAAVVQVQRGRLQPVDRCPLPEQCAAGAKHGAYRAAQTRARDHEVGRGQYPSIAGESHLVITPAMGDERIDPAPHRWRQVATVEAPGVVAAYRLLLHQRQAPPRRRARRSTMAVQRRHDEGVLQPAAAQGKVDRGHEPAAACRASGTARQHGAERPPQ